MGLFKSIKTTSGVDAVYHKVTRVLIDANTRYINVTVSSYVSKELADSGASPLDQASILISDSDVYDSIMTGNGEVINKIEQTILSSNPAIEQKILDVFSEALQVQDAEPVE